MCKNIVSCLSHVGFWARGNLLMVTRRHVILNVANDDLVCSVFHKKMVTNVVDT